MTRGGEDVDKRAPRHIAVLLSTILLTATATQAQERPASYPKDRIVRFITPYTPGGSTDVLARALAEGFTAISGQSVVVEGKPGAGGSISTTFVAKAPPDGYTLLVSDVGPVVIARSVYAQLPSDPVRDLVPIVCTSTTYLGMIVNPSFPAKTVQEFVALAKKDPGRLTFSSSGIGSIIHMGTELFSDRAGIDMTHVPYRGGAPATLAVLQGDVSVGFMNMPTTIQYVQAGQVRALGVGSLKPSTLAPDLPTIASQGYPEFQVSVWHAVMAPAATPPDVVEFLRAKIKETLAEPAVKKQLAFQGQEILNLSADECRALIKKDSDLWAQVATRRKVRVE